MNNSPHLSFEDFSTFPLKLLNANQDLSRDENFGLGSGSGQYREDIKNSGLSKFRGAEKNSSVWEVVPGASDSTGDGNGGIKSSAAISGDSVFFGSLDGVVHAISRTTGEQLWEYTTAGSIVSSPSIFDTSLFIGSFDTYMYALKPTTGELLWKSGDSDCDGSIFASPVVVPPLSDAGSYMVIIASGKSIRALYAINGTVNGNIAGQRIWKFTYDVSGTFEFRSTPAVNRETKRLFIGTGQDKKLLAIDLRGGKKIWEYAVQSPILSSPCLQTYVNAANTKSLRTYVSAGDGMYAFGQDKGKLIWRHRGNGGYSSPATSNDSALIFFGSTDGSVYGLSSLDGATEWSFATGGPIRLSSPVIDSSGSLFIGSTDGSLYALNSTSGEFIWEYATSGSISASPSISDDGVVYIGNEVGSMFAVGFSVPASAPSPVPVPTIGGNLRSQVPGNISNLTDGEIAAAVIFSILGFCGLLIGLIMCYRHSKMTSESRERSSTEAALEMARQQQANLAAGSKPHNGGK